MAIKIALAGNPNCGKTTMFNDLTMKSTGADGEELLIGLLMELAVKKGA